MTDEQKREHAEAIKHALGMSYGPPMEGEDGWVAPTIRGTLGTQEFQHFLDPLDVNDRGYWGARMYIRVPVECGLRVGDHVKTTLIDADDGRACDFDAEVAFSGFSDGQTKEIVIEWAPAIYQDFMDDAVLVRIGKPSAVEAYDWCYDVPAESVSVPVEIPAQPKAGTVLVDVHIDSRPDPQGVRDAVRNAVADAREWWQMPEVKQVIGEVLAEQDADPWARIGTAEDKDDGIMDAVRRFCR